MIILDTFFYTKQISHIRWAICANDEIRMIDWAIFHEADQLRRQMTLP